MDFELATEIVLISVYIGGVFYLTRLTIVNYEDMIYAPNLKSDASQVRIDVLAAIVIALWPIFFLIHKMMKKLGKG
jgi:hypothetical protein